MIKLALFETIKGSASEAYELANSVCNVYSKGGKQAILVNNVTKISTGWRVQARINLSQFASESIIKKASIGDDTHAVFTFPVYDAELTEESNAVLAEFSQKLDELYELIDEGKDPRFDGVTVDDVFLSTGSITLPAKAGFGYPHVIVPLWLILQIEYISEGVANGYHKVTDGKVGEPLQFSVNSGGVNLSGSLKDFLSNFTASMPSSGSTGVSSETVNNDADAKLLNRRTRR